MLRLLLVGLPLTVLFGFLAARVAFPAMPVMVALLLAAALAPTDAGLGAATVLNPVVPVRFGGRERGKWLQRRAGHPGCAVRDRRRRR